MSNPIVQKIAVKGVISNQKSEILILREAKTYIEGTNIGSWQLPGGRLDAGENFEAGLFREVIEETGLDIEIVKPIYVGEWLPNIKGVQHHIVGIFFYCKATSTEVTLSEEHDTYKWITQKKSIKYNVIEPDNTAIKSIDLK